MRDRLRVSLETPTVLGVEMQNGTPMQVGLVPGTGNNYKTLVNKPSINGVTLEGNRTAQDLQIVSEDTTAGWAARLDYIPRRGEIVIYTDRDVVTDEEGQEQTVPGIKIGDGLAYLADLPFQDAAVRSMIARGGVTDEERDRWNAKLNCDIAGETLILTRN